MNRRSPLSRVPAEVVSAEQARVAGATGFWSRLWRATVAAWRCSRIARAHLRRERAWRKLRAAHRALLRVVRR
jgi:hypothetical protein